MIASHQHDHRRLRDLADRLDVFLNSDALPLDREFSRVRWMLVRELWMHLASERRALADLRTRAGLAIRDLDLDLDDAFARHVVTWSGVAVVTAWDRYRAATRTLLARMRRRMEAEEAAVFVAAA